MTDNKPVLVIAEDEQLILSRLCEAAEKAGMKAEGCKTAEAAIKAITENHTNGRLVALIADLKLAGATQKHDGWQVITSAAKLSRCIKLAVYSGNLDNYNDILPLLNSFTSTTFFSKRTAHFSEVVDWIENLAKSRHNKHIPIVHDEDTKHIYHKLAPIYARSDLPILIVGPTGSGKESLARHIHKESGRKGPFHSVNCGALSEELANSELFGHVEGAFSGAVRHKLGLVLAASGYKETNTQKKPQESFIEWLKRGNESKNINLHDNGEIEMYELNEHHTKAGTLFLDEVTALPRQAMNALLRVLSTNDVRPVGYDGASIRSYCRIIAATNEIEMLKASSDNKSVESIFRRDLYFRLSGAVLQLHSLADRGADTIKEYLLSQQAWSGIELEKINMSPEAIDYIVNLYSKYNNDEPSNEYQEGNFRSLKNLLHRTALIARSKGASIVSLDHVRTATKHGYIEVSATTKENIADSRQQQIRQAFCDFLKEHGVQLEPNFSWNELISKIQNSDSKQIFAGAYIYCSCKFTEALMREIDLALTRNDKGNIVLAGKGKQLSTEMFVMAAAQYFSLKIQSNQKITDILKAAKGQQ